MFVPTEQEITINPMSDQESITLVSHKLFQAQGEWDLIDITHSRSTITRWIVSDQLIYQVQSRTYGMESKPILNIKKKTKKINNNNNTKEQLVDKYCHFNQFMYCHFPKV